jgi:hypothetical protein
MRNPTRYTLEETIGWEEFEDISCKVLFAKGHKDIKVAGKVRDGGRDAVVLKNQTEDTVFQISKEEDPINEKKRKNKKPSKFWREYDRWLGSDTVKHFVFVSSQSLGSSKIDPMKKLKKPDVNIIDLDELVIFLDVDPAGIEIKKAHAIFNKDLQEVFGADDKHKVLNEVEQVINKDDHYNIATVLANTPHAPVANTLFSMGSGNVTRYFVPKSFEDYQSAVPTVNMMLAVPNTNEGKARMAAYADAIKQGQFVDIPSNDIKRIEFKVGDKVIFTDNENMTMASITPMADNTPRRFIIRSKEQPDVAMVAELFITAQSNSELTMDNHAANSPLDIRIKFKNGVTEARLHYSFQPDKCLDAAQAHRIARIFNALNATVTEVMFDDKGIERKLLEVPPRGGEVLPDWYMQALESMSRIQQFFKVRLPNPLARGNKLEKDDYWSIDRLQELIEHGRSTVSVSHLSFELPADKAKQFLVSRVSDGSPMLAIGSDQTSLFLSILGVEHFPGVSLVMPNVAITIKPGSAGHAKIDVEVVNSEAYLEYTDATKSQAAWTK